MMAEATPALPQQVLLLPTQWMGASRADVGAAIESAAERAA